MSIGRVLVTVLTISVTFVAQDSKVIELPRRHPGPSREFKSPDGTITALVITVGVDRYPALGKSRVEIYKSAPGDLLAKYDFSSEDGEHGYGVATAQWTPDGQFFVFAMSSSGGHSPMFSPIVFWSRSDKRFYALNHNTASQRFEVSAPDKVTVNTWPVMKDVTLSLHALEKSQSTELK